MIRVSLTSPTMPMISNFFSSLSNCTNLPIGSSFWKYRSSDSLDRRFRQRFCQNLSFLKNWIARTLRTGGDCRPPENLASSRRMADLPEPKRSAPVAAISLFIGIIAIAAFIILNRFMAPPFPNFPIPNAGLLTNNPAQNTNSVSTIATNK
jgi:hypothetical protein